MDNHTKKAWYEIINEHYWILIYIVMGYNILLAIIDLFYPLSTAMMLTPVPIYLFLLTCTNLSFRKTRKKWEQEEKELMEKIKNNEGDRK